MKIKLVAAAFGVLLALGVISVGTTLAQSTVQGAVNSVLSATSDQTATNNRCQAWETALAKQLGIDVSKLQGAQKAAAKDLVDQALKDGKITAEQATNMKQRIDSTDWAAHCPDFAGGFGHKGPGAFGRNVLGHELTVGVDAAAKALNMTMADLKTALQSGKSVADIAKEKNVALDTVKKAIMDAETAQIDQAVKDGKLTADQAVKLKTNLSAQVDKFLQAKRNVKGGFPGKPGMARPGFLVFDDAAAKALNMTTADLNTALRSGKSVADVAKEKNVALDTVKKAIVDAATAQIDQAVKDGKLTADQATKLKDNLSQQVDNFLQAKFGAKGGFPGGFPGFPGGMRHGR
jgi:polyhydroxyalkanoate synthesis regulator phasin